MRRRNEARRRLQALANNVRVQERLAREDQRELSRTPRLAAPLSIGIRISRLGWRGLGAGWSLSRWMRFDASYTYSSDDVSYSTAERFVDGHLSVHWGGIGLTATPLTGRFTPYVSAMFLRGGGTFNSWEQPTYRALEELPGGDGSTAETARPSEAAVLFHSAELRVGVDLQLDAALSNTVLGAFARLGIAYRPIVHSQAKYNPGEYDAAIRRAVNHWHRDEAQWDVVFELGGAL